MNDVNRKREQRAVCWFSRIKHLTYLSSLLTHVFPFLRPRHSSFPRLSLKNNTTHQSWERNVFDSQSHHYNTAFLTTTSPELIAHSQIQTQFTTFLHSCFFLYVNHILISSQRRRRFAVKLRRLASQTRTSPP